MLDAGAVSDEDIADMKRSDAAGFAFDHVFIDEGQDWPESELLISPEEAADRAAARWLMIPLTRAIDTLVINVARGDGRVGEALHSAADASADFVEWIRA